VPPFKGAERELLLAELLFQTSVNKQATRDDQRAIRQLLSELVEQSAQGLVTQILIGRP
jgi:ribosomal protein S3AE